MKNKNKLRINQMSAGWLPVMLTSLLMTMGAVSFAGGRTEKVIDDMVTLGIQINGKVRAEITIQKDAVVEDVKNAVVEISEIQRWVDGKEIKKFIYIPGKIISIVI